MTGAGASRWFNNPNHIEPEVSVEGRLGMKCVIASR